MLVSAASSEARRGWVALLRLGATGRLEQQRSHLSSQNTSEGCSVGLFETRTHAAQAVWEATVSSGWSRTPEPPLPKRAAPPRSPGRPRPSGTRAPAASPSPSPHLRGLGGAHAGRAGLKRGAQPPRLGPHADRVARGRGFLTERGRRGRRHGARPAGGCACGGAQSHEPALVGDGGGAARRPHSSETPQAGGNCPVTTEAPRTRHKPLPGLM